MRLSWKAMLWLIPASVGLLDWTVSVWDGGIWGLLTLEEKGCLVGDQVTGEVLRRIHQTGDDCAAQICAFEKVEEGGGTAVLSFDLDGSLDHCEGLLDSVWVFAAKALDGLESFGLAAAADEPPGGLGGEKYENKKRGLEGLASRM